MKGRIDAVYISIRLKGHNGIRVAQSILKEFPDIKIIFVSDDIEMQEIYSRSIRFIL